MHTSNTLTLSTFLTTSENKLSHKVQWHGAGVAVTDTRIHLFFLTSSSFTQHRRMPGHQNCPINDLCVSTCEFMAITPLHLSQV